MNKWNTFNVSMFNINSLYKWAKEDDIAMYDKVVPTLNRTKDISVDEVEYDHVDIDADYLTVKEGHDASLSQKRFRKCVTSFVRDDVKTLIIRSRYGSGKTTFLQRLLQGHPEYTRVLFITYRQSLARDIMRNFKQLGFKNYLDAYDDPSVWNNPRLIVQLDSLMNVMVKNDRFMGEDVFDAHYDLIVLDEVESLLNHFDEETMNGKEIMIYDFFDKLITASSKVICLDGDVSDRCLQFITSYGNYINVVNVNWENHQDYE